MLLHQARWTEVEHNHPLESAESAESATNQGFQKSASTLDLESFLLSRTVVEANKLRELREHLVGAVAATVAKAAADW